MKKKTNQIHNIKILLKVLDINKKALILFIKAKYSYEDLFI